LYEGCYKVGAVPRRRWTWRDGHRQRHFATSHPPKHWQGVLVALRPVPSYIIACSQLSVRTVRVIYIAWSPILRGTMPPPAYMKPAMTVLGAYMSARLCCDSTSGQRWRRWPAASPAASLQAASKSLRRVLTRRSTLLMVGEGLTTGETAIKARDKMMMLLTYTWLEHLVCWDGEVAEEGARWWRR